MGRRGLPAACTASYRPIFFSAFIALAHKEMPAPISRSSPARSKTVASTPARRSAIAAESPPMPPPTTMALIGVALS